jgi:hypothetical protein
MGPLDRFGKFLIEHLRDAPLDDLQRLLDGKMKAPAFRSLQVALGELDSKTIGAVRECVVTILNTAMHDFLFALTEATDRKGDVLVTSGGVNVAAVSDGLQGEPYGEDGWIARFSRHPES